MARGLTFSGTTGTVTASGGTLAVHKTGLPNAFNLTKFKAAPSAGSGPSTIEAFRKDTVTGTDMLEKWKAVSGNVYDPMDISSGTPAEMNASHFTLVYEDQDGTGEFHMKFTNNDSVDKTYDYEGTYEEVWLFDSARVGTAKRAELLDGLLYLGGRTSGQASLRTSGTVVSVKFGDDSDWGGLVSGDFHATRTMQVDGALYLGGSTASEISLRRSGTTLLARTGDDSAYADFIAKNVLFSGGNISMEDNSATGVRILKSASGELSIKLGNLSGFADLKCGRIIPTSTGFGGFTGSIQYLDWSSNPQTLTVGDGLIF